MNRTKEAPFFEPMAFMLRRAARRQIAGETAPERPQHRHAPAPAMRWARPGERPPSRFGPGQRDDVIERFDAYRTAWQTGRIKRGG